jgi:SnoaL-like domain
MNREDVSSWLDGLSGAWVARDVELACSLFSDCVDYRETPFSDNAAAEPDGIRRLWEHVLTQKNIQLRTNVEVTNGDSACASYTAVYEITRQSYSTAGIWILSFREGRCRIFRQYFMHNPKL